GGPPFWQFNRIGDGHNVNLLSDFGADQFGAVDKIYKGYLIWYNRKKHERVARMQLKIHMVTIEDLMPQDHFLRKLEKPLDLSFVYEETRHLYSQKYGRPPIEIGRASCRERAYHRAATPVAY